LRPDIVIILKSMGLSHSPVWR